MDQEIDSPFGFAPEHDSPIPHMQRTRDYYKAIGYTTPYRWAHYLQAPFTPLPPDVPQEAYAANLGLHYQLIPYDGGTFGARLSRFSSVSPSYQAIAE